ncbi:AMP-binding protein [Algoriphagus namhaensis]
MFRLRIEDKILQSPQDFQNFSSLAEDWAKQTIAFCASWLNGQQSYEMQTSGSTGKPKRLTLSRKQMTASAKATQSFLGTGEQSRILNCLHPNYIAGRMNLVRAMVWNCEILCEAPSNQPVSESAVKFQPTFLTLVPTQVPALLHDTKKGTSIKHLLIGGAPLSAALKEEIVRSRIPSWQTFGMTETVSHIALAKITRYPLRYHVLPRVEIGTNESGALWVKSSLSAGKKIQTNDLVQLVSPTEFYWKGRLDFVINSGGIKLHPEELEPKMEKWIRKIFPGTRFFLFGLPDDKLGQKLCLLLEASDSKPKIEALQVLLRKEMGSIQSPKEIFVLESFAETASGKVDRKATISRLGQ